MNIHEVGDADLLGKPTLAAIRLECLFPANDYPFAHAELDPYDYVNTFKKWARSGKTLRFIVSDTTVNLPVRVESISYGERDGTNDVYATISLREHRTLAAPETESTPGDNDERTEDEPEGDIKTYTAVYGDTLCSICRRFYGDGSAKYYNALAKYNGKANPNLLATGEVLKIPPKSKLGV